MNNDFLLPYKSELINDEPIEIFDDLFIHPIKMRDYIRFSISSSVLKINKNESNDPKIISMSYLDYLIYLMRTEQPVGKYGLNVTESLLGMIMALVTQDEKINIEYGTNEKKKSYLIIGKTKLYKKEFEKLRKLILLQNIPDYEETYINPELAKDLEKAEKIRNKGRVPCDIEKQEMAVVIGSSLTLEDVKNLSIRKFFIALELIDKKLHYTMAKTASLSGFVEFKSDIVHYLIENESSMEDKVIDYSQFKNKINSV